MRCEIHVSVGRGALLAVTRDISACVAVIKAVVADIVVVVVVTSAAINVGMARAVRLDHIVGFTLANTCLIQHSLVVRRVRACHAPAQEVRTRRAVIRAGNAIIVTIVVLSIRASH